MEYCEHISYIPEQKTYHTKETIFLNEGVATCSKCHAIIDITPLQGGDQTILRVNEKDDYTIVQVLE